jgi:hypothetical protein
MSENSGIVPISLADRDLYREQWVDKTVEEIKKHKYLNPLYDAAFKAFLSDEQALKSFLNGVFKDDRNKIESVVIKNPEINMIFPVVKPFRLDIRAKTSNGYCINVEMQKARPDYFVDRMFLQQSAFLIQSKYEWDQANFGDMPSNLSDEERAKREIHRYEIPPTYTIWICDFPVPKQKSYRGDWSVRNEKGLTLSDKVMYIVYDLTKFNKPYEEIRTAEDRWLYLLKHAGTAESLPDFKDDIIAKAINRLLVNRASDKLLKEQAKDMVMTEEELDYLAMLKVRARSEGKAEGLVDGRNERNVEMAFDMLADNEPIEKIVKYSHLSMEKVLELRNSQAMFTEK